LERLGWKPHRIWSTDWFNDPRQEVERLRKVTLDRLAALKAREQDEDARANRFQTHNLLPSCHLRNALGALKNVLSASASVAVAGCCAWPC
jgi:hypothetical protein